MQLREIRVDGFGALKDLTLTGLPEGLCLFLGPNEAGKSTLLAFVRRVLFGFPDRRSRANPYDCPPGVPKGGRLVFERNGDRVVVERFEGPRGGAVRVRFGDGTVGGEAELRKLVGSTTRDVYENVFAFSLEELQSFETLANEQVAEALSVAAMGESPRRLAAVRGGLEAEIRELYTPRGSKPEISRRLRALQDLAAALRDARRDPEVYEGLCLEIERLEARRRELEAERARLQERSAWAESLTKAWPAWAARERARVELAALPDTRGFPPDGLRRFEGLVERRRDLDERAQDTLQRLAPLQAERRALRWDEAVLAADPEVRGLERRLAWFEGARARVGTVEAEVAAARGRLRDQAARLGPGWDDPARLRAVDLSRAARDELERVRRELAACRDGLAAAQREEAEALRHREEAKREEEARKKALEALPEPVAFPDRREIQALYAKQQAVEAALREAREVGAELERGAEALARTLRGLGPDWTEERVAAAPVGPALREALRERREGLRAAERRLEEAERALAGARGRQAEADDRARAARAKWEAAAGPTPGGEETWEDRRRAWEALEAARAEYERLNERLRSQEARLADLEEVLAAPAGRAGRWLSAALLFLGAALGIWGAVRAEGLALVLAAVLGLAGAAGLWLARRGAGRAERLSRRRDEIRAEVAELRMRLDRLAAELRDGAAAFGIGDPEDPAAWRAARTELDRLAARASEVRALRAALEEAEAEAERANRAVEAAEGAVADAERALAAERERWAGWLRDQGFGETLGPEAAVEALRALEAARDRRDALRALRERRTRLEEGLARDVGALNRLLQGLGRPPVEASGFAEAVGELLAEAERVAEAERGRRLAEERWREAAEEAARAEARVREAREGLAAARARLEAAERAWAAEVARRGLPAGLTDAAAPDAIARVKACREILSAIEARGEELRALREEIAAFEGEARALLGGLGRDPGPGEDLPAAVGRLFHALEEARAARDRAGALDDRIRDLEADLEGVRDARAAIEREIAGLLAQAGAADEEAFRRLAEIHGQRLQLEGELRAREAELGNLLGPDALERAGAAFAQRSVAEWRQAAADAQGRLAEVMAGLDEVNQALGARRRELEQLERRDEVSALRLRWEAERGALAEAARRWARLRLAQFVLDTARERYEEAHRPAVLREAERVFARLTRGRYTGIRAPLSEPGALWALAADGTARRPEELSRGTAEQLYLSIRFGFVRRFLQGTEPLPLVFDDILVNFDPERAQAACEAIADLARDVQILFFTCHPETAERFRAVCPHLEVRALGTA
ncbi:AAA family ATPase [Deferrisoma palaeochoriense]